MSNRFVLVDRKNVMEKKMLYELGECPKCKKSRTKDGHDPCIANLPGVRYACCGHGLKQGYIYFENGICIRMNVEEVQQYDPSVDSCEYVRTDEPR